MDHQKRALANSQFEAIDLRPTHSLRIDPDRNAPRCSRKSGPSVRIDFDSTLDVVEQICPKLTSMNLAHKHSLHSDIKTTRHDNGKSSMTGDHRITVSREADTVRLIEILGLRAICVRLPRQHHSWYQTTAMIGWLVRSGPSITHGTERAI